MLTLGKEVNQIPFEFIFHARINDFDKTKLDQALHNNGYLWLRHEQRIRDRLERKLPVRETQHADFLAPQSKLPHVAVELGHPAGDSIACIAPRTIPAPFIRHAQGFQQNMINAERLECARARLNRGNITMELE